MSALVSLSGSISTARSLRSFTVCRPLLFLPVRATGSTPVGVNLSGSFCGIYLLEFAAFFYLTYLTSFLPLLCGIVSVSMLLFVFMFPVTVRYRIEHLLGLRVSSVLYSLSTHSCLPVHQSSCFVSALSFVVPVSFSIFSALFVTFVSPW